MEIVTPEGRILTDEPEDGQIIALAERAKHLTASLNQVRKALGEHGANLKVTDTRYSSFSQKPDEMKFEAKITKLIEY